MKFKGVFHPVIISPDGIEELSVIKQGNEGWSLRSCVPSSDALVRLITPSS